MARGLLAQRPADAAVDEAVDERPGKAPVDGAGGGEEAPPDGESSNVAPEEQKAYDEFVNNALLLVYDKKTFPTILKTLQGNGEPVDGLAHAVVGVVVRLAQSAKQAGKPISGDVMMHAGIEILEDLANLADRAQIHKFNQKELDAALYRAMDMGREAMTRAGLIDGNEVKQDFGKLVEADKAGKLGELIPGIDKFAAQASKDRPPAEQPQE